MRDKIDGPSRRDFLKGVALISGGYAISSMLVHPQEAMGQSIQGYLGKVPMEARWNFAAGGLVGSSVNWAKTFLDKEGREKFVENRKKYSPVIGAGGKAFVERFGLIGNDAKSAVTIIPAMVTIAYGPQQKFEIEEATAEKAKIKCINCAFWNAVQAQKITDDLCSVHSQYYWAGFAKAMNPKMTSTLVKARPLGDPVCEWVIELKS